MPIWKVILGWLSFPGSVRRNFFQVSSLFYYVWHGQWINCTSKRHDMLVLLIRVLVCFSRISMTSANMENFLVGATCPCQGLQRTRLDEIECKCRHLWATRRWHLSPQIFQPQFRIKLRMGRKIMEYEPAVCR